MNPSCYVYKCDFCDAQAATTQPCLPTGWTALAHKLSDCSFLANEKLACPKHAIQVTHKGDIITLYKSAEDGDKEVHHAEKLDQGGN